MSLLYASYLFFIVSSKIKKSQPIPVAPAFGAVAK